MQRPRDTGTERKGRKDSAKDAKKTFQGSLLRPLRILCALCVRLLVFLPAATAFAAGGKVYVSSEKDNAMPDVQDPLGLTRAELETNPRQASPAALQFNTRKSVDQVQLGTIIEQRITPDGIAKLTAWTGHRSTQQFQAIPVATQAPPSSPGGVISLYRDYQGLDAQWTHKTRIAGAPFTLTAGLLADELQEGRQGYQNFVGAQLGVMGALRREEDNRARTFDQYLQGTWTSDQGVPCDADDPPWR